MTTGDYAQASADMLLLSEPELEFNYGQRLHDPHLGLSLFGPYDSEAASHPRSVIYGVVGPPDGVDLVRKWSQLIQGGIVYREATDEVKIRKTRADERKTYLLWPPFPGHATPPGGS